MEYGRSNLYTLVSTQWQPLLFLFASSTSSKTRCASTFPAHESSIDIASDHVQCPNICRHEGVYGSFAVRQQVVTHLFFCYHRSKSMYGRWYGLQLHICMHVCNKTRFLLCDKARRAKALKPFSQPQTDRVDNQRKDARRQRTPTSRMSPSTSTLLTKWMESRAKCITLLPTIIGTSLRIAFT